MGPKCGPKASYYSVIPSEDYFNSYFINPAHLIFSCSWQFTDGDAALASDNHSRPKACSVRSVSLGGNAIQNVHNAGICQQKGKMLQPDSDFSVLLLNKTKQPDSACLYLLLEPDNSFLTVN